MKIDAKQLPRGQAELTIELTPEEYDPFLKKAALAISEKVKISGFRPGKAPYDIIKARVGEAKIWEEAIELAVRKTLLHAFDEQKIKTVGAPKIEVAKLAPGNNVAYKAVVNILPTIKKLTFENISVKQNEISIKDSEVEKSVLELQKMRGKEALVPRECRMNDKVEIDFSMYLDKIPLDNGSSKKLPIYLGEKQFVPGFEENIVGMRAGDSKEFALKFPDNYHQRNIAGKIVEVKARALAVYEIQLPKLDDAFAKDLRFNDLAGLKKHLKENLLLEARGEEEKRADDEMVDAIIEKNAFTDIPDVLINSEASAIANEIEHSVTQRGISFGDYLKHLKKTKEQLLLDVTPMAIKRVKGAILFREIAEANNISATDEEVLASLDELKKNHTSDEERKTLHNPEYKNYLKNILTSDKVMKFLRGKII